MINYYYIDSNSLTISTETSNNKRNRNRIKNNLLWEINSYLSKRFELYDFSVDRRPRIFNRYIESIPIKSFRKNMLNLYKLDETLVTPVVVDDIEIREQHKIIDPELDYECFKKWYTVETIDIEYFATEDLKNFKKTFIKDLKGTSRKDIIKTLKEIADVYISMHDSSGMELFFNERKAIEDVLSIVKAHCKQSNVKWR